MKEKCGAKTRSGGSCKNAGMENGRCRMHGGASLRGMAHPNYQGKGHSRYIPKALEPAITAFLESGDPLDLIQPIATWEGRIDALLRSLDLESIPTDKWDKLREHWARLLVAGVAQDQQEVNINRRAIEEILETGGNEAEIWKQIMAADEQRRKLISTEDKKRERKKGYMRAEEVRYQNQALRLAVMEGVELIEDYELQMKVRKAIAERFIQIVSPADVPRSITADS